MQNECDGWVHLCGAIVLAEPVEWVRLSSHAWGSEEDTNRGSYGNSE